MKHASVHFGGPTGWKGHEKRYDSFRMIPVNVEAARACGGGAGACPPADGAFSLRDEQAHWELLLSDGREVLRIRMRARGESLPESEWIEIIARMRVV